MTNFAAYNCAKILRVSAFPWQFFSAVLTKMKRMNTDKVIASVFIGVNLWLNC